ncbi:hypothetical protein [Enhygromyxa salina]|nr:hypothetical protein [Enhygromyxa salina]
MTADVQMLQRDEIDEERTAEVDEQWRQSLLDVMRQVVNSLPDETTLGELVTATRGNPHLAPMLGYMSVQELIDMAVARPILAARTVTTSGGAGAPAATNGTARRAAHEPEIEFDEEGNPLMDLPDAGPAVIRRRADVPDGDLRILRTLADEGPLSEPSLLRATKLTSEQIKLVLRHLRSKGFIHVEGSGQKRKVKITRNGAAHLRKLSRKSR